MQEFHQTVGIVEASSVGGRTSVVRNYHRYPLKLMAVEAQQRPRVTTQYDCGGGGGGSKQKDPTGRLLPLWVYVATFGGGLVAGDAIALDVTVRRGAALVLTTQASTKVYKNHNSGCKPSTSGSSRAGPVTCSQTLSTDVEAGALLAIVPHAVTCFADARYKQTQVVRMAKGANLVLVDWLTSGRMARGEQWAFDNYETSNDVLLDGQLLVHEAVRLSVQDGAPSIAERMRGYCAMATILVVGPRLLNHAKRILESINKLTVNRKKEVPLMCSASPICRKSKGASSIDMAGVMVKIAAKKTSQATDAIHEHFDDLWQETLGCDPYQLN